MAHRITKSMVVYQLWKSIEKHVFSIVLQLINYISLFVENISILQLTITKIKPEQKHVLSHRPILYFQICNIHQKPLILFDINHVNYAYKDITKLKYGSRYETIYFYM